MGRSPLCHCPCGQSNLPEELCCNPNVNGPVLAFYEEVSASENPDYSVNVFFFDWDDPDGDEVMWTAWYRGAYADPEADEVYYIKLIGDNLLCNSFIEAPFVQMSGMRLGDYVKINTYNPNPNQSIDVGKINYIYGNAPQNSLLVNYRFSNTEVIADSEPFNTEINGYCFHQKQDPDSLYDDYYYLAAAELCDDTYPIDSWPVRARQWWGYQTAKFWAADPEEQQTIYYVASGYSNTFDRASLVIKHNAQIQMFMNTATTESFFNPRQTMSYGPLFVNDALGCCCDNYVTQFSSGTITIGPVRSDCWDYASGCFSLQVYPDSLDVGDYGSHIRGGKYIVNWDEPHTPPIRYGVKFFDNYDDYIDFLNDRPMSGIAELVDGYYSKNSILVEDARELGPNTCLDGSSSDGELDVGAGWYFYPNTSTGSFYSSAGQFDYNTEAFDCCQRFMSIGLADQDPGILTGESVISNEPSTARVYSTYAGDRMKPATISDYWVSGYYELNTLGAYLGNRSYTFTNPSPNVNKGIIYLSCTTFSSTNANYISCGTYDYSDVSTIVNMAFVPYVFNSYSPLMFDIDDFYAFNNRRCGVDCNISGVYSIRYGDYKSVYFSQSGCLGGGSSYLDPVNYYNYYNPVTVSNSEAWDNFWRTRNADRDARSCDQGPYDCSFCEWLSDYHLTERPMKLVAYEFDINYQNTFRLMNFWDSLTRSRRASRYSWYKTEYNFYENQDEQYDCANDVPLLAKLLLDLGATLHTLDTDNRDGLRCGDAGFGEYHFLKDHTSTTINSHMHMMYEPRCKNENYKARIGRLCGTLQDVYDGLGFFEMTSMTDNCGRNIQNPCNVYSSICPDCNDFSCSQGEHDSVYIAVKGSFNLDDIGEDFCIDNPIIDCSPTICYNGWGFEHDAVSWVGDSC